MFCDTLILSDVHLGSEISRAAEATALLESVHFRRLILLGDIFSDLNFSRLTKEHWRFLSTIRKLSNPRRKREIVWVEGNHDHGLSTVMSHLVGVEVFRQYVWEYGGKRHLAIHGHQFDRFVINNLLLSRFGHWIYLNLQKLDSRNKRFVRHLDRLNTRWLRLSSIVAHGAISYAIQGKADRVFCGHTHAAHQMIKGGVEYFNTGSWIDSVCTYVTVGEEGARIHEYASRGVVHRHPREEREDSLAAASGLPGAARLLFDDEFESVRC